MCILLRNKTAMQDCKLHLLRWSFLPKLAALLHAMACLLGAGEWQDRYMREMGPDIARSGLSTQQGAPSATLLILSPASHRALLKIL
jgi:hypothetical protein